jgi:hypothetical protein
MANTEIIPTSTHRSTAVRTAHASLRLKGASSEIKVVASLVSWLFFATCLMNSVFDNCVTYAQPDMSHEHYSTDLYDHLVHKG